MTNLGELIEKLCIANIKLYEVCNKKANAAAHPEDYTKKEMAEIMAADIELCKQRGTYKSEINRLIDQAVRSGESDVLREVKKYG